MNKARILPMLRCHDAPRIYAGYYSHRIQLSREKVQT
jgi:hypothetical protein